MDYENMASELWESGFGESQRQIRVLWRRQSRVWRLVLWRAGSVAVPVRKALGTRV